MLREVVVENKLLRLGVEIAYTDMRVSLRGEDECVDSILREAEAGILEKYGGEPSLLSSDPIVRAYRRTMWRMGFDPTKIRPSMEALARRILRGRGIPRINCIVDSGNAVSLLYMVPVGLYDVDRLPSRTLELKTLDAEAPFKPIGGPEKRLAEGTPALVSGGLVVHLYPSRDSESTMITDSTKHLLAVVYGAQGVDRGRLEDALARYVSILEGCGCRG